MALPTVPPSLASDPPGAGLPAASVAVPPRRWRTTLRRWTVPAVLFALALGIRLLAAAAVPVSPTEPSAYYVEVARQFLAGHGLVADAMWSYATPPLVLPEPAFALWMPLPSLLVAVPMALIGPSFGAAQLATVLLGAAVAPLAWVVAREAAQAQGLSGERALAVTVGAGAVAALAGPFLAAATGPDSATPFTILAVGACLVMPAALAARPTLRAGVALGILLALAWLAREEAVEIGLAYLLLLPTAVPPSGARRRWLLRALGVPVVAGALAVAPWLVRQALTFGTPLPGQALQNAWLAANDGIFAYLSPPTLASFLAQGPGTIAAHIADALLHDLVDVLLVAGLPFAVIGLLVVAARPRWPAVARPTALRALLLTGGTTYLITSIAFPVATQAGTFLHAAGPLLVGLVVACALGLDAFVARVRAWRRWERANAWLAPLLVIVVALPVAAVEVATTGAAAASWHARVRTAAAAVAPFLQGPPPATGPLQPPVLISDRPIWLAEATGWRTLALPDEPPSAVAALALRFGARYVVLVGVRGRYPAAFAGSGCFEEVAAADVAPSLALATAEVPVGPATPLQGAQARGAPLGPTPAGLAPAPAPRVFQFTGEARCTS